MRAAGPSARARPVVALPLRGFCRGARPRLRDVCQSVRRGPPRCGRPRHGKKCIPALRRGHACAVSGPVFQGRLGHRGGSALREKGAAGGCPRVVSGRRTRRSRGLSRRTCPPRTASNSTLRNSRRPQMRGSSPRWNRFSILWTESTAWECPFRRALVRAWRRQGRTDTTRPEAADS